MRFSFDRFELDTDRRSLVADGKPQVIGARAFDLLVALVERRVRNVSVEELLELVWPGLVVEENNLRQQVAALRRTLGPSAIVTVPGRGYRFGLELDADTAKPPPDKLPVDLRPLIGRDDELPVVVRLLAGTRLLTLIGAGGIGKTRLALEVARQVEHDYADGACVVELAALADPERLTQAVAAAMGVSEEPGRPLLETVVAGLNRRERLIVLDNCEHLVDACAAFAERLLAGTRSGRILATSREALEIPGEVAWRVPSLATAEPAASLTVEQLMAFPATWLFVQCANAAAPTFRLNAGNMHAVAQICRRLEGIPLALELAAARLKAMRADQIAEMLHDRLGLLDGGSRTAMRRHRTLRALIDWSHDLLSGQEQMLMRRLSAFSGGWTVDAAERVCADNDLPADAVMGLLTRLVEKSLVVLDGQSVVPRYHLLEPIRQYTADKLVKSSEAASVRGRHLDAVLTFAQGMQSNFFRPDQSRWYAVVDVELANIRTALEWSSSRGAADQGLVLVQALHRYWVARLVWREAVDWLERLLQATSPMPRDALRAASLAMAGHIANYYDPLLARRLTCDSLAIYRALDDTAGTAYALWVLGWIESRQLDGRAVVHYEESIRLALAVDSAMSAAHAYAWYGAYRVAMGHFESAKPLLRTAIEWAHRLGHDATLIGRCEGNLALAEMLEGHFVEACAHLLRCDGLALKADNQNAAAESSWLQGRLALCEQDFARALGCFGRSTGMYRRYARSVWVTRGLVYLMIVHDRAGRATLAARLAGSLDGRDDGTAGLHAELGSVAAIADYDAAMARIRCGRSNPALEAAWTSGLGMDVEAALDAALEPSACPE